MDRFGGARIRLGTLGRSALAELPLETPRDAPAGNVAGQCSAMRKQQHSARVPALPLRRRTRSRTGSLAADEGLLSTIEERSDVESLLTARGRADIENYCPTERYSKNRLFCAGGRFARCNTSPEAGAGESPRDSGRYVRCGTANVIQRDLPLLWTGNIVALGTRCDVAFRVGAGGDVVVEVRSQSRAGCSRGARGDIRCSTVIEAGRLQSVGGGTGDYGTMLLQLDELAKEMLCEALCRVLELREEPSGGHVLVAHVERVRATCNLY